MNRFNFSTRLIWLVGLLAVLLLGVGGVGLFGLRQANEALHNAYANRTVPMEKLGAIQRLLLSNRLIITNALLEANAEARAKSVTELEANMGTLGETWDAFKARTLTPDETVLADWFAKHRERYVKEGLQPAAAALRDGDVDGARHIALEALPDLYDSVRDDAQALLQLQIDTARAENENAAARYQVIRTGTLAAMVAGLALALVAGIALIRSVTRALTQAVAATDTVAGGDLSRAIVVKGRDEVAHLLHSV